MQTICSDPNLMKSENTSISVLILNISPASQPCRSSFVSLMLFFFNSTFYVVVYYMIVIKSCKTKEEMRSWVGFQLQTLN